MISLKWTGLAALQLLVVGTILTATIIVLHHPACVHHMVEDISKGVVAGLLVAAAKSLMVIRRPILACRSLGCWGFYWWVITCREAKWGLVAGYLVGLVVAMHAFWKG